MHKYPLSGRFHRATLPGVLALLMICGLLVALAPNATAAVELLYFRAKAGSDNILVEWETATERDIVGFNLYRSKDVGSKGQQIGGGTFPITGNGISGAKYDYSDTGVEKGVLYYYSLEEISAGGGLTIIATANAGIDVPTPTPTPSRTATVTRTPTATATGTLPATNVPTGTSGGQPTATRQFTLTPRPGVTSAVVFTPMPPRPAPATATPIGAAVVSTPTGQPPTGAPVGGAATTFPTPLPPAEPTAIPASPSPEIVQADTVQPVNKITPTATQPPRALAVATAPLLLGTPERTAAVPTPASTNEAARNTGSLLLLGGGAILLAAAIGGGILLYLRSRQP